MNKKKLRVAAIITEYWDISHADVIVTKMLEGFRLDGRKITSTLEIVAMYVDQTPIQDMSRDLSLKHGFPIYKTVSEALLCGGNEFAVDGIIIIGEHGAYPSNELGQTLYPRRRLFEDCLQVMLEKERVVPVYSDKGFAVVHEDIVWMYEQIKRHHIPFMSSSVIPFGWRHPVHTPFPNGAPLHRMFGFAYGSLERYTYHALEMMQCLAENRAFGETGIDRVRAFKGKQAIHKLLSDDWRVLYESLGGFINLRDVDTFPHSLVVPVFFELDYADGLTSGILFADPLTYKPEIQRFVSTYQVAPGEQPICHEFRIQDQKPYMHFGRLVLEIERFLHTGHAPFPVERSLLTTGGLDALMQAHHYEREIETPHLSVKY